MQSNWNQLGGTIIMDLIVAKNPDVAPVRNIFQLNSPVANDGANAGTHNSKMVIEPQLSSDYTGAVTVTYNRLEFDAWLTGKYGNNTPSVPYVVVDHGDDSSPITEESTTYAILQAINDSMDLRLSATDVATAVVAKTGNNFTITLTFGEDSFLFLKTKTSTLTLTQTTATDSIITEPVLVGLDEPTA